MRLTAITIPWADGEFTFDLRLKEVRALQEKTGLGPAVILMRIQSGEWKVDDYRETILQGLLGGGMAAPEASKLVRLWVDERPAQESLLPAQAILMAWIMGAPQPKKASPSKTENETATAPAASTSTQSMETEPQSDLAPAT
jgi:hypothetical protein